MSDNAVTRLKVIEWEAAMLLANHDGIHNMHGYRWGLKTACYIESLLLLAKASGLDRERALRPFDIHRTIAAKTWDAIQ